MRNWIGALKYLIFRKKQESSIGGELDNRPLFISTPRTTPNPFYKAYHEAVTEKLVDTPRWGGVPVSYNDKTGCFTFKNSWGYDERGPINMNYEFVETPMVRMETPVPDSYTTGNVL